MTPTDRYLRQATRGLHGQTRKAAELELRGAIEDKVWRLTLLGLTEADATQAALRDLGSPHAIARGLTRVHTLPRAALTAVLAGAAVLLGVQALAQVPTVRALADPTDRSCQFGGADLQRGRTVAEVRALQGQLAQPGGRARLEAACRATLPPTRYTLLRLSDLITAFTKGGVNVRTLPPLDGFLSLTFPGTLDERTLDLSAWSQEIQGETYVQTWSLINHLRAISPGPVRLIGRVNPVVEVGATRLQLGTQAAPVSATDLYAAALMETLHTQPLTVAGKNLNLSWALDTVAAAQRWPKLPMEAPDGALFLVVSNERLIVPKVDFYAAYLFRIQETQGGRLPTAFSVQSQGRRVSSLPDLVEATARRQPAFVVYRFDPSDVRHLKLSLLPTIQE